MLMPNSMRDLITSVSYSLDPRAINTTDNGATFTSQITRDTDFSITLNIAPVTPTPQLIAEFNAYFAHLATPTNFTTLQILSDYIPARSFGLTVNRISESIVVLQAIRPDSVVLFTQGTLIVTDNQVYTSRGLSFAGGGLGIHVTPTPTPEDFPVGENTYDVQTITEAGETYNYITDMSLVRPVGIEVNSYQILTPLLEFRRGR